MQWKGGPGVKVFRGFGSWVLEVCPFSRLVRVGSYVLISIALDAGPCRR